MVADSGYERRRRRRRRTPKRKLLLGEHVEVLYSDEGLRGSWHPGIVIDCEEFTRLVEYTNLLSEDNCSKLTESIHVSASIEGLNEKPLKYRRGHIRPIPPRYEIEEFKIKYGMCVDALVDDAWWEGVVFDRVEGSKERLVFFPDQGDQEMVAVDKLRVTQEWDEVSGHWKPRGEWLLLQVLQPFEEEEELPVSIREIWFDLRTMPAFSDKIGVWTIGSPSTWHILVSELIQELRSVVFGVIPSKQLIDFPICSGAIDIPTEEFPCLGGTDPPKDADGGNTSLGVTSDNSLRTLDDHPLSDSSSYERHANENFPDLDTKNNIEGSEDEDSDIFLIRKTKNGYSGSKNSVLPVGENCGSIIKTSKTCKMIEYQEAINSFKSHNQLTRKDYSAEATDSNVAGIKIPEVGNWKPLYLEAAYHPEAVEICGGQHLRKFMVTDDNVNNVRLKAKKHLIGLGWKIETRKTEKVLRVRFTSPEGKPYPSLHAACHALLQGHPKKKQKRASDKHTDAGCLRSNINELDYSNFHHNLAYLQQESVLNRRKCRREDSSLDAGLFLPIDETSHKVHTEKSQSLSKMIDSGITQEISSSVFEEHWHTADYVMPSKEGLLSNGPEMVQKGPAMAFPVYDDLEPGSFPEAVLEYKKYWDLSRGKGKHVFSCDLNVMRLKARRHLKFMGWKFWVKGQHRKEFFVTSPTGKPFRSLSSACDEYLREENLKNSSAGASLKKRLGSRSANLSKFSESRELGVDRLLMKRHRKSKKIKKVISEFAAFSFAAFGDRKLKYPSGQSFVCEKSKRRKVCQASIRKGHELGSCLSPQGVLSRKRPQQNMVQTSSQRVDRTVLSLLIDNDMILPRQKVSYIRKRDGQVLMEGHITREGIKCKCCRMVYTLSNFEVHAGSTYRRPAASIFLQDGRSLLECQMQMINQKKPKDFRRYRLKGDCSQYRSDSICSVCHDGGSIVLCDHCPSSFHLNCVGLENVPKGKWYCPACRCGVCGRSEYNSDTENFTEKSILYCDQCEREYHVGCLRKGGNKTLSSCPVGNWCCSKKCYKIFCHLRQLLGISRPTSVDGLSWTILRSSRENGVDNLQFDAETMTEHDSKLCVALDVLHECFVSIIEPRTQSDFVADLLFNRESELRRLNFYGFYTMVLEKGDELVSVATFRIYGDKVAEMPLVGTRVKYRRQGMCRLLMNELEKLLSNLGVESLLLPAVPQLLQTWTSSFGFSKMTSSDRLNFSKYTILYFQATTMCRKLLIKAQKVPAKSKRHCKELLDISTRSTERVDSDLCRNASEEVGLVEPINAFPLVEADHFDQIDCETEADHSPVSTCINPIQQREPELGVKGLVNVAPDKRMDSCVPGDTSPILALEFPNNLNSKFLRKYHKHISKDGSVRRPVIKNVNNGGTNALKYVYKRRMSSNTEPSEHLEMVITSKLQVPL